ncbi:RagB/SusD family nutrient uptake outer membrane protein [Sphingobacterium sp. HJSM2_6]|uniref:RagB/SusD family nutrient uptake outer membrane protein n=1 Tax=Sphingobacterium sp. HJSM2_6 TaxID=3366264 RepID=UPI003BF53F06
MQKRNKQGYFQAILLLVVSLTLTLASCSKDYLERSPSDLIDEKKVFSNLNNAEAFLNNAYREIPQLVYRNDNSGSSFFNLGSGTDESAQMWGHHLTTMDFNNGNWNPVSFPLFWTWQSYYQAIRRINLFLKNYELIPEEVSSQTSSSRKNRMLGEAYVLRGYYYFLLYSMWGKVPILTNPILPGGAENIYLERSSIDVLVAQIEQDLLEGEKHLPNIYSDADYGRVTSLAAASIRSRLWLYFASPLSNPSNDAARWEKAETFAKVAKEKAELQGHLLSLTPSGNRKAYELIFLEINNPETLWASFSPNNGDGHYWDNWGGSLGQGGWYGEGPIQDLVDAYETKLGELPVLGYNANGTPIANPASGFDPAKPFENRDDRFYQTILYHGASWKGRLVNVSPGGADYSTDKPRVNYFWKKYMLEQHNLYTGNGMAQRRFILFRLSELYLNFAEARNERLSSPDAEVYASVNVLRARAGLPNLPTNLTKLEMRDRIQRERRVEFAMENHRFFDVRRWKIAEIVDNKQVRRINVSSSGEFTYPIWGNRIFDRSKHYLFPIPQTEIEKSAGILSQNEGW